MIPKHRFQNISSSSQDIDSGQANPKSISPRIFAEIQNFRRDKTQSVQHSKIHFSTFSQEPNRSTSKTKMTIVHLLTEPGLKGWKQLASQLIRRRMQGSQDKQRFFTTTALEPFGTLRLILELAKYKSDSLGKPETQPLKITCVLPTSSPSAIVASLQALASLLHYSFLSFSGLLCYNGRQKLTLTSGRLLPQRKGANY